MKAVAYTQSLPISDAQAFIDIDLPQPEPAGRDLLVKVEAVSVNPIDAKVRQGMDPGGTPRILGWDAAGTVVAAGPEARLFTAGNAVFYAGALDRPGSNAEYQLVDERLVGAKPQSLGFAEAAAMPLTSITAWELLFDRLQVPFGKGGEGGAILVLGGAGGVGSILVQLARRLTPLTIIVTASRPETADWATAMGAHHIVDHRRPLVAQVRDLLPAGVHYAAALTHSAEHFDALVDLLRPEGRLGIIDDPSAPLDITKMKQKSLSLCWESMFTRSKFQTETMSEQHRILQEVSGLTDAKLLRSTLHSEIGPVNAANLKKAHARIESGRSIGKNVLTGFRA